MSLGASGAVFGLFAVSGAPGLASTEILTELSA
jgi:membrane associated rhomboid family serine protease